MIAAKNAKVAKADWKTVKLGEVVNVNPTFSLKKGVVAKKVGMDKITPHCRDISSYSEEAYSGGAKFVNGCTLMARITPCLENGKISQVRFLDEYEVAFGSTEFIVFEEIEGVSDKDFIYYLVNTALVRQRAIDSMVGSSGRQRAQSDEVAKILIPLPPLPTQRKIAAVLGALDDKIENNRKICANLEAQAQALFKSWFVDFEPWGGKMPKDWKMGKLYEFADIIYGAPFKSKLFNEKGDGRPIIRIRDLKNNETKTYTTERHDKEYVVQAGDLVVGMDGEFRPYVWGNKPALLNQRVCVFKPKDKVSTAYLLFSIKPQLEFVEATEAATTVIHIGKEDFDSFKISIPSKDWLSKFNGIAQKQIDLSTRLRQYNVALAELRDALLPKLMSGELDVSEVAV